jgi:hypothetical protein
MLTVFCRTVVSTNELHGNTLPERTVGSSGLLLSFGLAEECSCSVQVDRHYGPLLAYLTLYGSCWFCYWDWLFWHVPMASGMAPSKTIIVYLYLFIYFYLVLGMSSFGNVCSVVDSFEWFIDMPRLCRKLVSGKLGRSDYNVARFDSCIREFSLAGLLVM